MIVRIDDKKFEISDLKLEKFTREVYKYKKKLSEKKLLLVAVAEIGTAQIKLDNYESEFRIRHRQGKLSKQEGLELAHFQEKIREKCRSDLHKILRRAGV